MAELDARLNTIAEFAGKCETLADIGADHGRLGARLLLTGQCAHVIFTDISEMSLAKASRLINRLKLAERATFLVGDGALALSRAPDAAVIAGMGGVTIAEIVEAGKVRLGGARLILQPNVAVYELRKRLARAGYEIIDERLARAAGRQYVIIKAAPGNAVYSERELLVGPVLIKRGDALLADYAAFRKRVALKAARGARESGCARARELFEEAEIWEEVEKWRRQ